MILNGNRTESVTAGNMVRYAAKETSSVKPYIKDFSVSARANLEIGFIW